MSEEQTPVEEPKQPKYKWVPAQHGEGSSNILVKVLVEDEDDE